MPDRLRSRAVAPRLSRPAACFERLIFANENRCNHQHACLGNLASRKFSGDCAWNPDLCYAVVVKERERGQVVHVMTRIVYGTAEQVEAALRASPVSYTINT